MAQVRPKILLRYGRINLPIRVPISDELVDPLASTFLTTASAASATTLTAANITGFAVNQALLIGEPGLQGSEIIKTSASVAPSGSTITLASALVYAHPANTPIYRLYFNQVELYNAPTVAGVKTILQNMPVNIVANNVTTDVNDRVSTGGFYFARFLYSYGFTITSITRTLQVATATYANHGLSTGDTVVIAGANEVQYNGTFSVTVTGPNTFTYIVTGSPATPATGTITLTVTQYSPYSDPAPYEGYTIYSARSIIDNACMMINKQIQPGSVITDEYAFSEIDNCQMECLREFKRWSFMQSFDTIIGTTALGTWKIIAPEDIDTNFSNKSTYNFRIGKEQDMYWVDKEEWNAIIEGIGYSTLSQDELLGATSIHLTSSKDFNEPSGTIRIGDTQYSYSANDKTTNIITIDAPGLNANMSEGQDVFQFESLGYPVYWTIYGGYIYHWPIVGSPYEGRNYYLDYYVRWTPVTSDYQYILLPDPTVAQYYLAWKFMLRLNNGEATNATDAMMQQYLARREKMKQKESINRNFILDPNIADPYDWPST